MSMDSADGQRQPGYLRRSLDSVDSVDSVDSADSRERQRVAASFLR